MAPKREKNRQKQKKTRIGIEIVGFLYIASPQQGDLRLLGPPPGRDADGGARTRDRWLPADFRADSQATVPPKPLGIERKQAKAGVVRKRIEIGS
ncbi:hypothetical protein PoB_006590500 [Plakobranchus ocellatus]|uniref:Uncharacterized protein n=1 Tax=Plakobranchus ocellatus TaxID=259542 RepID=A0AAV4D5G8_9GAST|nr:hypothetical protein PoB_006590500 [Plakobranchus ocellatus]